MLNFLRLPCFAYGTEAFSSAPPAGRLRRKGPTLRSPAPRLKHPEHYRKYRKIKRTRHFEMPFCCTEKTFKLLGQAQKVSPKFAQKVTPKLAQKSDNKIGAKSDTKPPPRSDGKTPPKCWRNSAKTLCQKSRFCRIQAFLDRRYIF